MNGWRKFFPEAQPRPIQEEILDYITENIDKVDAFFIEAPPGVGKSAIALCLANWWHSILSGHVEQEDFAKSYITTTTIALENQYMHSYRNRGLLQLHSASHYTCFRKGKNNLPMTCEVGKAVSRSTKTVCKNLMEAMCPYKAAKMAFEDHHLGILNAAYLITESVHVGKLGERGLLIADEGHTLCDAICNFLEFKITEKKTQSVMMSFPIIPEDEKEIEHLLYWIEKDYLPALKKKRAGLVENIEKLVGTPEHPAFQVYVNDEHQTASEIGKVGAILNHVADSVWVLERPTGKEVALSLTPISSKGFARNILKSIAGKIVLLSATIVDFAYHAEELGIPMDRLATFNAPSPFPVSNRPIFQMPYVKLDHKNITGSCADAAKEIIPILEMHKDERGIIFVSSYPQARGIVEAVNRLTGGNRLRTHNSSQEKGALLIMHEHYKDSVLVSPSLHEGLDLRDDLSRFQILLKLPFPSLGSKLVRKKMEVNPKWYPYSAVLKIIQASGRSVRSNTDHAVSYIMDKDWDWFFKRHCHLFPEYWRESLTTL